MHGGVEDVGLWTLVLGCGSRQQTYRASSGFVRARLIFEKAT